MFVKPLKLHRGAECFYIEDAHGRRFSYVYFEDEPGRRERTGRFTREDAEKVAKLIARRLSE